jgi:predicted PurR-regulated permease PerM
MSVVLKWAKNWLKEERSAAEVSSTTMLMLFGIIVAIGLGWLVAKYVKQGGTQVLQNMTDTASQGVDPNTPPSVVEGWD